MRSCRRPPICNALAAATLAVSALVLSAPLAIASSPAQQDPAAEVSVAETGQAQAETAVASDEYSPINRRQCMQKTGSLITAVRNRRAEREGRPLECAQAFGRAYSDEDLRNTGGANLGEILRSLDPSIR